MAILFIYCIVTLLIIGTNSFYNIRTLHENNVQNSIQSSLDDVRINLNNAYESLQIISMQFAYENTVIKEGSVANDVKQYIEFLDNRSALSDRQTLDFSVVFSRLRANINLIMSINPAIGLSLFYREGEKNENQIMYSSAIIAATQMNIPEASVLKKTGYITINGIHKTMANEKYEVISVCRKMDITDRDDAYVYVETSREWLNNLIREDAPISKHIFLITDKNNKVVYSNNPGPFPVGLHIETIREKNQLMAYGNYYLFCSEGNGLKVMTAMHKSDYNRKIINWVREFSVVVILSLLFTLLIAVFIWGSVYRPIRAFRSEFQMLADNVPSPKIRRTRVKEFDELLLEFYHARANIIQLIQQVDQKEKKQKELEIEKLMIQINPHFIYNTLNSIQWLARLNGQLEIENMTTLFIKLLKYNLGKKDIIVTVEEEIHAMQSYIELQKLRYQSDLNMVVNVELSLNKVKIPRFILQPIIENTIFHGMQDKKETTIKINVEKDGDEHLHLSVEDNGQGISEEEIKRLLNGEPKEDRKTGFGIGLKYVNRMIRFYYGEQYQLQIISEIGAGTTVSIYIPTKLKEEKNDQNIDC